MPPPEIAAVELIMKKLTDALPSEDLQRLASLAGGSSSSIEGEEEETRREEMEQELEEVDQEEPAPKYRRKE